MIEFKNAYFLKMGRRGVWADDGIRAGRARIGWTTTNLDDIVQGRWDAIEKQIRDEGTGGTGAATMDFNSLRRFVDSTTDDLWITFHNSRLWWCHLSGVVQQDQISKYRATLDGWHDKNVNNETLSVNQISGRLSQLQGYRATICRVLESDVLRRTLNATPNGKCRDINDAMIKLQDATAIAIGELHWKDFEVLVDLVFRQSGWRRVSVLGETMKFVDLELEDPVTGDRYIVQVKSKANESTFREWVKKFEEGQADRFRKGYFVVHSPDSALATIQTSREEPAQLIHAKQLAEMVVDSGLVKWVMDRVA